MAALREIFARFGVQFDDRQLQRGERSTRRATGGLRELAGVIGGAALIAGTRSFITGILGQANALELMSRRLNISTGDLQSWRYAAERAGASAEDVEEAISELTVRAYEAAVEGSEEQLSQFNRIGVALRDQDGQLRTGSALLMEFSRAIAATSDETVQLGVADALLSEEGKRLLPFLRQGPEALQGLREEYQTLGGEVTPEFIAQSRQVAIEMLRARTVFNGMKVTLASTLLPTLTDAIEAFTRVGQKINALRDISDITTPILVGLGAMLVAVAVKAAIAWGAVTGPLIAAGAAAAALYLIGEDLWLTWQGGDTVTRDLINNLFPGLVNGLDSSQRAVLGVASALGVIRVGLEGLVGNVYQLIVVLGQVMPMLQNIGSLMEAAGFGRARATVRIPGLAQGLGETKRSAVGAVPLSGLGSARSRDRAPSARERATAFASRLLPASLRAHLPGGGAPRQTVDARTTIAPGAIQIQGMSPEQTAIAVHGEVARVQQEQIRRLAATVVPRSSS